MDKTCTKFMLHRPNPSDRELSSKTHAPPRECATEDCTASTKVVLESNRPKHAVSASVQASVVSPSIVRSLLGTGAN